MLVIFALTQGRGHQPDKSAWEWKYTCATITKVSDCIKKLSITLTSATEQMLTTWQKKHRQWSSGVVPKILLSSPEKTADISRHQHWFPREMTSERQAQKFHTDDATLLSSIKCFWLVEDNFPHCTTSQKHYPNQGRVESSVWNFRARFCQTSIPGETSAGVAECRLFPQTTATPTNCHQNATRREPHNVKTERAFLPSEDLKVLPGRENFLLIYCHKSITETLNASKIAKRLACATNYISAWLEEKWAPHLSKRAYAAPPVYSELTGSQSIPEH